MPALMIRVTSLDGISLRVPSLHDAILRWLSHFRTVHGDIERSEAAFSML